MALFDLDSSKFRLMPKDTKGTPEGAVAAAEDAIAEGAELILGPLFSESVQAVKAVTEPRGTSHVIPCRTSRPPRTTRRSRTLTAGLDFIMC